MNIANRPIGIFDSGVGGLTVAKQLINFLPNENIIYLGDTARVPYGNKSKDTVIKFSRQNVSYLLRFKVKLIVAACNTSSSLALAELKKRFNISIVGVIDSGVEKALKLTKNNRLGIIGTNSTIVSEAYQNKIRAKNASTKIFTRSCPLFVPLAEEGWLNDKAAFLIAKKYLLGFKKNLIDTMILGCTHYPLLKRPIQKIVGRHVKLVDSAREVALSVKKLLAAENILNKSNRKGKIKFYLTDKPYEFKKVGRRFLGCKLRSVHIVKEREYFED